MNEALVREIKEAVNSIMNQKDSEKQRRSTEAALIEAANTVEAVQKDITSIKEELQAKEAELKELEKEGEGTKEDLKETEAALEVARLKIRIVDLEKAGILVHKKAQSSKVKSMTDSEFDDYKDELMSLRAAVKEELKEEDAPKSKEGDDKEGDTPKEEEKKAKDEEKKDEEAMRRVVAMAKAGKKGLPKEFLENIKNKDGESPKDEETKDGDDKEGEDKDEEKKAKEEEKKAKEEEAYYRPYANVNKTAANILNFEVDGGDKLVKKYKEMGSAFADLMLNK